MLDKIQPHADICHDMHELYKRKNADYGDSFAQLRNPSDLSTHTSASIYPTRAE